MEQTEEYCWIFENERRILAKYIEDEKVITSEGNIIENGKYVSQKLNEIEILHLSELIKKLTPEKVE